MLLPLLLCTALLYLPGLGGPFLFDDAPNIVDNAFLTAPKDSLLDWWSAAQSSGAGKLRRPLPMLSFALQLPGGAPATAFAFKVGNLLVHGLCGILVFLLARLLLRTVGPAQPLQPVQGWLPLLAAAFWLLNPLHLSTVLYPVQRMAQFSTLFVLAGLVLYAHYRLLWARRGARADEPPALLLWLLLCAVLALLSKENGLLLFWLVGVLELTVFLGRWNGRQSAAVAWLGRGAFFLPLIAAAVLLWWQWDWVRGGYSYRDYDVYQRLWTEARVLWAYAGWFLFPRLGELGLFHDDLQVSTGWLTPPGTLLAVLAWCAVLALGIFLRRRFPWLLLAVLFFLAAHSIESGFLALELVFEHRNYLPSVGLALLLAAALGQGAAALERPALGRLPAAFFLCLFSLSLLARAFSWSSELQLASDSYARHPGSARSAHFYANSLLRARNEAGLDATTAAEYLTVARHEFEALHARDRTDLSALVMLYTMDSRYFPEIADPERWLQGIEYSLRNTRLQATEYAAMRVLVSCVLDGGCDLSRQRLARLVDLFSRRYVYTHAGAELRLRALEDAGAPAEERIRVLEAVLAESPQQRSLYYPLISAWLELGNFAAAHEVIVRLLAADRSRRQLAAINALFAGPELPRRDD